MDPLLELPPDGDGALTKMIKDKKKKKKKKAKLSAKQKLLEKLDKAAVALMKDDESSNTLFKTVAYWLNLKEKLVHKILYQQCLLNLEQELQQLTLPPDEDDEEDEELAGVEAAAAAATAPTTVIIEPINDDEIDFEELMKHKTVIEDSTENLDAQNEPVVNIDYKISYDDLKIVAVDLDIPCSHVGLHAICKILDPEDNNEIDYRRFTPAFILSHIRHRHIDCVRFIVKSEKAKDDPRITFKREIAKNFASKYPLYTKFDIKFIVFSNEKDFYGHIKNEIIYSHMTIFSLKQMIKKRFDIAANEIFLFNDISTSNLIPMEDSKTLEDYGYIGESDYNLVNIGSKKQVLYYDFDCGKPDAIIHCDYYFTKEPIGT